MKRIGVLKTLGCVWLIAGCSNATSPGGGAVASLVAVPDTVRVFTPDTTRLTVNALDGQGHLVTGVSVTFASSDTNVATVSSIGLVTATGFGAATLTVSSGNATTHIPVLVSTSSPLDSRPFGAAVSAAGVVYVTQLDNARVGRATLPSRAFSAYAGVGTVPTSVTFDASGATAWVTNQADFTVGVIDVSLNTETTTFTPPGNSNTALVRSSPQGNLLWVTTTADSLFGVNPTTNAIVHRVGTGGWGNGLAFTPTDTALVYVGV
ncbi:MAG TPA: hypothetical protein VH113_04570, partial [Gemmatimonadales bacterium]|nr:hypothetical protein [Gemmatimonadales bacterium]